MYKPCVILEEVRQLIDKGIHSTIAIKMVSEEHDIRLEDVDVVARTGIPELYAGWLPNQRVKPTKSRKNPYFAHRRRKSDG